MLNLNTKTKYQYYLDLNKEKDVVQLIKKAKKQTTKKNAKNFFARGK